MRKLATISKILDIQPIVGADSIEVATVRGWHVVIRKGEFKIGDLCVYFEIDSFLPVQPEFEFLRKLCFRTLADGSEGFRIRTIKLRGQVSQGICFPLSILETYKMQSIKSTYSGDAHRVIMNGGTGGLALVNPYVLNMTPTKLPLYPAPEDFVTAYLNEETDLTDFLGIKKWEPPIPASLSGKVIGRMPSFLFTTDEERIQNIPWVLPRHAGKTFYITEKLDGTSTTFFIKDGVFGVCSREWQLEEDTKNTYWRVARLLDIENRLRVLNWNIALQGEIVGEGIQGNSYKLKGHRFYVFNVFDIDAGKYLSFEMVKSFAQANGFEWVPVIAEDVVWTDITTVDEIVRDAVGASKLNPMVECEGLVYRSMVETVETDIPKRRLSFKVISNKYILDHDA